MSDDQGPAEPARTTPEQHPAGTTDRTGDVRRRTRAPWVAAAAAGTAGVIVGGVLGATLTSAGAESTQQQGGPGQMQMQGGPGGQSGQSGQGGESGQQPGGTQGSQQGSQQGGPPGQSGSGPGSGSTSGSTT